jgi:hypothetical protein
MIPLFERAQEWVGSYFGDRKFAPENGSIRVRDQRYILVRAESLSVRFFDFVQAMYPGLEESDAFHAAGTVLYDLALSMGQADAAAFCNKLGLSDPVERLSCGPVHFAHSGWAYVDISAESSPSPDDNYYLLYDHPYSFEAASWKETDRKAPAPICFMNSGYSAGWCEVSFGLSLVAREVLCCAKGDPYCRFLMAPPSRIEARVAAYRKAHPELFGGQNGQRDLP